ncbi:N-acetylglucosamine kinase [Sanyastnella coralliicola]|uniref:N-acetylglucosamine kinase n=1 Tax=Sanyastnella coralliicola TaxID=3069118 RepID=UPI0027BAEE6C|nr:N-acetylglucosamine kinase [Longitalea sp. SCSIO 12813]
MILIADSGSTKTDWRLIDREGNIHQAQTIGLNPYFVSDDQFLQTLRVGPLKLFTAAEVREVYFYGSGLGSARLVDQVKRLLAEVYRLATIHVEHDLLGAARALCGSQPGIAAILGTGMNTCAYDGEFITKNIPSLGFILGDEGSGTDLGRRWVQAFLLGEAPDDLIKDFYEGYGADKEIILDRVYKGERPNRFLASFVPFVRKHLGDPFMLNLVKGAFAEFFDRYVVRYEQHKEWPLHISGSIGFHFHHILQLQAEERDIPFGSVLQKPIAALTLYHLQRYED